MAGMGIRCFFGAAMKRTGVSGRAKGSTGINWSALYPDNGLKSLMVDKGMRRWARNDGLSRGWALVFRQYGRRASARRVPGAFPQSTTTPS